MTTLQHPAPATFTDERLQSLAAAHATPLWVYDADTIRARVERLRQFDTVRFAQKACSNTHVLRLLRSLGVQVDAVSAGEIQRALHAGYDARGEHSGIVFTADEIDRATLELVAQHGIPVNAGSVAMIEQLGEHLGERASGHRLWLRINPGFGHGHSRKTNTGGEHSKHGIWPTDLPAALEAIARHGLRLVGLHMHIGSGVDYAHLERVCDAMVQHVSDVVALGHDVTAISAGGGLSIPYREGDASVDTAHYFSLWDAARRRLAAELGHAVHLEIEPGRFLVAESGALLAEVRAVKEMGGNHFVLCDAGFNDLVRPAMYGGHHAISVIACTNADVRAELARGAERVPTVVAGPLCESGDVFTQDAGGVVEAREIAPAETGDLLVFHDAGAYGASMSSNYNTRPLAAEVLVDGATSRVIRRRQTVAELIALED
ncbi:diaminopimelate decarboxylase [Scleromatobacter humisilvae]|uniref:Diaminopimelate decarboxylase n=1 Tax=Scleromatobacter humisilvae TaxID=2897159 RepID=A0A9X2C123_9BURK|nr:diaminopimelate decarboxylase [Scleromatobacter humisilvae]MCK9684515.1 diaminopimelate decarboxylase [Scleromatobacter humisilvae]